MILKRVLRQRPRDSVRDQRGTASVEFALVAMVLVVLMLAAWDFGRLFDAWLGATNSAREGARYGAVYAADKNLPTTGAGSVEQKTQDKALAYLQSGFGSRRDI